MAASPDSHAGSTPPAFSFGDLGKPRSSSRLLPAIKDVDPDASSELELGADDILESSDIESEGADVDAFEQAAAGIVGFDHVAADAATLRGDHGPAAPAPVPVILSAREPAPRPSFAVPPAPAPPTPKAPPPPSPKPMVAAAPVVLMPPPVVVPPPALVAPAPAPAPVPEVPALVVPVPVAVISAPESEPAPITAPTPPAAPPLATAPTALAQPSTLMGMPAAPITSPIPLEDSVIVKDEDDDEEGILRTQEMRGHHLAKVAQVAAFLDGDIPESTQILARSDMPAQIRQPQQTPPVGLVNGGAPTAPAWANGRHPQSAPLRARPASVGPIAVDLPRRAAPIAAEPRPAKKETNPVLIGGLFFAAAALVGVVGVAGYFASRSMSEKPSIAIAPAPQADEPSSTSTTTSAAPTADPTATADTPAGAAPVVAAGAGGIDVSSLPSAPAAGVALPPSAAQHPAAAVAAAPPPPATHVSSAPPLPVGRAGAPLPPPGAAPQTGALPPPAKTAAVAAAPAVQATTGTVNVDSRLRAILVDGNYHHVSDGGSVTLSCGAHRIKVGMKDEQTVNVPCGGAVSM